jgi:nitroreductase
MELREALLTRRTVHAYRREPIPEAAVERALRAAVMAPNHRLTFPWRFVRVGPKTRQPLAELAVRLKPKPGQVLSDERLAEVRTKVLNPAELFVVSIVRNDDPVIAREDYASAACAIQNLMLSLCADGFGAKWSTGYLPMHADTYALLGIDAAREEIVGFVWAGVPERVPAAQRRPELGELVRVLP